MALWVNLWQGTCSQQGISLSYITGANVWSGGWKNLALGGNSAKGVAKQTDVVITMLPDSAYVSQVILGPAKVIGAQKNAI